MFKLKNKDLNEVFKLLYDMEIDTFRLIRKRGKFLDLIQDHYLNYYEKGKNELVLAYSKKDDNGDSLKIKDENGFTNIVMQEDKLDVFNNELEVLDNELFQLEDNELNVQLLKDIYEILSNDEFIGKLSGSKSRAFNLLCDELENVLS